MNVERPLTLPLRTVRERPFLVDDLGVLPPLAAVATPVSIGTSVMDVAEVTRWTRAWLVACQGALHERGVIGTVPPWTVALPVAELPSLRGDPDRRRRAAALLCLERAGIATLSADGSRLTFTERAFTPHRAALDLDWSGIVQPLNGEPASLLVVRALAEQIMPPDAWTPVTLRELAARTGYAPKQVRVALRRLVEVGLLHASESSGAAVQFVFSPAARGVDAHVTSREHLSTGLAGESRGRATVAPSDVRGGVHGPARAEVSSTSVIATRPSLGAPNARIDASVAAATERSVAAASPPPESSALTRPRAVAIRITLNGVTLSLGPGLTPHVALGPDGVPHVSFEE